MNFSQIMKKQIIFFIIILISFTSCMSVNPKIENSKITFKKNQTQNFDKLLLVVDQWPPFTSYDLDKNGICSEIVSAAMEKANLKYEIKFKPWARCMDMVKHEEAFATYPWFYKKERTNDYIYSKPIMNVKSVIFYKKNNSNLQKNIPEYKSIYDLRKYKFGGVFGYFYEKDFTNKSNNFSYNLSSSLESAFKVLDDGKVDIIYEDEAVGWYIISKIFPGRENEFTTLEKPISTEFMYMLVNKSNPHSKKILDSFNQGLYEIKKDKTYDNIIKAVRKSN